MMAAFVGKAINLVNETYEFFRPIVCKISEGMSPVLALEKCGHRERSCERML
jgi:hypothetical protein